MAPAAASSGTSIQASCSTRWKRDDRSRADAFRVSPWTSFQKGEETFTMASTKPRKTKQRERNYEGPAEWIMPMMEEIYSRLQPKSSVSKVAPRAVRAARGARRAFLSTYQHGQGEEVLARVERDYWHRTFQQYHERRVESTRRQGAAGVAALPPMPAIPGQANWTPLGPG